MVKVLFVLASTVAAQPDQPHLAQAWTALSSGDGLPGQIGKESYLVSSDKKFKAHKYEYPEQSCTKISLHDPTQLHHIAGGERNYYLGCDSVDCCYSDFQMKSWDLEKSGLFSKVEFIAYEDTTELNDKPVQGAEHWQQSTKIPFAKNVSVGYDYYLHRTDAGDVISHRIDYTVAGAQVPGGSILYGDFEVQHDLETFKEVFTPPAVCLKNNVLKCPDQKVTSWEKQHFKHDHALRAAAQMDPQPTQPHLAQAWTAMSSGDGLPGQTGKESYLVTSDKKFKAHKYEYPEQSCTKISLHDPTQLHHIAGGERNYYLGCDAVNCCYSDFQMKPWDIEKSGLFNKIEFVGYEDTTELDDKPVQGAEHWRQSTKIPFAKNVSVGYDYYIHRTDAGDVISHRIDYTVAGAQVPGGSILYGDFEVQHDIDTFKNVFTPPAECLKNNVLKCPNQQVATWEAQYFQHDLASMLV